MVQSRFAVLSVFLTVFFVLSACRFTVNEHVDKQSRISEKTQGQNTDSSAAKSNQMDGNYPVAVLNSAEIRQYFARITGQLQSYWKLPDYKDWSASLLAKVVVIIDKSGKILDVQFEKRSGDNAFDRLVRKTLDNADPLPPIPPALKKERLEIGLNFTPGSTTGR